MAITREFRETVLKRAKKDRRFREAMLIEAVNELLAGDLEAGKSMLRDYVNATITFDALARKLDKPSKSVQRMLGPNGNPTAENLLALIKVPQKTEQIRFHVKAQTKAA